MAMDLGGGGRIDGSFFVRRGTQIVEHASNVLQPKIGPTRPDRTSPIAGARGTRQLILNRCTYRCLSRAKGSVPKGPHHVG